MKRIFLVVFLLALTAVSVNAQENVFHRMVGDWLEQTSGTNVMIREDGTLFNRDTGPIRGTIMRSITGGGNFSFENEKGQCSYFIALMDDDAQAHWRLTNETVPNYCPKVSIFRRIESPTQKRVRLEETVRSAEAARRKAQDEQRRAEQAEKDRRAEIERRETFRKIEEERARRAEQDRLETLRQEAVRRAEVERQDRERAERETEERRYKQVAGECDRLAAAPLDKDKPADVAGMPWRDLKTYADAGVQACGKALDEKNGGYKDHPRLVYQMARVLQWSSRPNGGTRALELYQKAANWGHAASYENLGDLYRDGKIVPRDIDRATLYWKRGAELGDAGSNYQYGGTLIANNRFNEGLPFIRKAADMGHDGAISFLNRYNAEIERQKQMQGMWAGNGNDARQTNGQFSPDQQLMMNFFGAVMQRALR